MGYRISTAVGCFLINWPSIALLWRNLLKNIDMSAHSTIFGFVRSFIHQLIQFLAVPETSGRRSIPANRGQAQYGDVFHHSSGGILVIRLDHAGVHGLANAARGDSLVVWLDAEPFSK